MGDTVQSDIRHALETASKLGFRTVRIKQGELRFRAEIGAMKPLAAVAMPEGSPELEIIEPRAELDGVVEAPMVGYFQFANGSMAVGTALESGDIIGSITALGIVNEVVSEFSGEVAEVLVDDGDPVEYGQSLIRIEVVV